MADQLGEKPTKRDWSWLRYVALIGIPVAIGVFIVTRPAPEPTKPRPKCSPQENTENWWCPGWTGTTRGT